MRRDDLSIELSNADWLDTGQKPEQPRLTINFEGSEKQLKNRFQKPDSSGYTPAELDLFYRRHSPDQPGEAGGVFGVTDSTTGDYIIEVNASLHLIEEFVNAVNQYAEMINEMSRYTVELQVDNQEVAAFEKETFLVYGADGTLLRHRSLIPDSIEI